MLRIALDEAPGTGHIKRRCLSETKILCSAVCIVISKSIFSVYVAGLMDAVSSASLPSMGISWASCDLASRPAEMLITSSISLNLEDGIKVSRKTSGAFTSSRFFFVTFGATAGTADVLGVRAMWRRNLLTSKATNSASEIESSRKYALGSFACRIGSVCGVHSLAAAASAAAESASPSDDALLPGGAAAGCCGFRRSTSVNSLRETRELGEGRAR
mmetsp:Transcript_5744/g.13904  ORF Transcript_5744/g.13904 Transcript_5744/m.13904 type:complete len:216 (-) Transcript_5744:259-906(-)